MIDAVFGSWLMLRSPVALPVASTKYLRVRGLGSDEGWYVTTQIMATQDEIHTEQSLLSIHHDPVRTSPRNPDKEGNS
jgi:hypothetical protein